MNNKEYTLPDGRTAFFFYDDNGIGQITLEAMDFIMSMITEKWIPCSDRLPEKHGRYLVSAYDSDKKCLAVGISFFYPEINDFRSTNAYEDYNWEVKAWMPLLDPYKEKGKRIRKREKNDGR